MGSQISSLFRKISLKFGLPALTPAIYFFQQTIYRFYHAKTTARKIKSRVREPELPGNDAGAFATAFFFARRGEEKKIRNRITTKYEGE
jgi:hypothetical protein